MSSKTCHLGVTSVEDLTQKVFSVVKGTCSVLQGTLNCTSGKLCTLTKGLASQLWLFKSRQVSLNHTSLSLSTLYTLFSTFALISAHAAGLRISRYCPFKWGRNSCLVPPASWISCLAVMMMLFPSTFTSSSSGLQGLNRVRNQKERTTFKVVLHSCSQIVHIVK